MTPIYLLCVLLIKSEISIQQDSVGKAKNYFQKFGYLTASQANNNQQFMNAIKRFQEFRGLPITGELDIQTAVMLDTPRYCQLPDNLKLNYKGSKGNLKTIKYVIKNRGAISLSEGEIDAEVKKALKQWSQVTNIEFVEDYCTAANIQIQIGDVENSVDKNVLGNTEICDGCSVETDPKSGLPILIKINDQIHWTKRNFYSTVLHQLGHALGLGHTNLQSSAMYPYVDGSISTDLDEYDVKSIQNIHGRKKAEIDISELCDNPRFDTIFRIPNGTIYIFKDDKYWQHNNNKIVSGPHPICTKWLGLPCLPIDAAFTYRDGKLYFFRKDYVWIYNENQYAADPQLMSQVFPGIPTSFDTATVWSSNERMFFFLGNKYWGFDQYNNKKIEDFYPLIIDQHWRGIPSPLNGAMQIGKANYFFRGDEYYKYQDDKDQADPGYPKSVRQDWLHC